jgi:hypothetical protein
MKKALLVVALLLGTTGCASSWFQDFKSDPVKQTNLVLDSASSIEQVAIVTFNQFKILLPADKQAVFQAKFDGSIVALNKTMDAVRTAVKAAAEAQDPHPDLSKVIADVITAVDQVKGVIDEVRVLLKTPQPLGEAAPAPTAPASPDPVAYDALGSLITSLKPAK